MLRAKGFSFRIGKLVLTVIHKPRERQSRWQAGPHKRAFEGCSSHIRKVRCCTIAKRSAGRPRCVSGRDVTTILGNDLGVQSLGVLLRFHPRKNRNLLPSAPIDSVLGREQWIQPAAVAVKRHVFAGMPDQRFDQNSPDKPSISRVAETGSEAATRDRPERRQSLPHPISASGDALGAT